MEWQRVRPAQGIPSCLPEVLEAPLFHFQALSSSPGPVSSFLPGLMSLGALAVAGWLCVPSLDLVHHPRWWGYSRGRSVPGRDSCGHRGGEISGTGGGDRLEMGAPAWVTSPLPGLLPPRLDLRPTQWAFLAPLGHRNLPRGHEPILRLDPRL